MSNRPNPYVVAPALMQQLIDFSGVVTQEGLETSLLELVKIRASQINGCAVCLHMHVAEALKAGETHERIHMLDAWREAVMFSDREKAALAWTEALTTLHEGHASDADYAMMAAQFTQEEQVRLTMMIAVINSFNKFGVGFQVPPIRAQRAAA